MAEEESSRSRFRNLSPKQNPTQAYQPGFMVMKSGDSVDKSDAQFGMIISLGGGVIALLLGIWTFMVSETDTDWTFFWLSVGSSLATIATFVLVEIQYRRQGSLSIIHDYMLSFGLLFGLLCAYWFSRFTLYLVCGHGAESTGLCQGVSGAEDWMPGGWGVVIQAGAVTGAIIGFWHYTKRVNGGTLPRLVLVLAPLAIMLSGASIWVDYAANTGTLPVLIAVIMMSTISMAVATDSDRSPLFLTAAIVSSLTPFLYEIFLDRAGEGLSMLILIVLIQGVFAAHPGLSQKMIEKGSIALVALIILAQWVGGVNDAEFILLEPIQHDWISLQLMLWVALLVGYFWPVHKNRVPSMPIGLGFALLFIPGPGSMLAWCLGLLSFIYMLTVPQTRRWVADWTFIGMMFAWTANGWISDPEFGGFEELSLDPLFAAVPPLALIITGHFAVREGKLANSVFNTGLLMVLLSNELLMGSGPWLPFGLATFLIFLVWQQSQEAAEIIEAGEDSRMRATGRVALASIGLLILELAGRLDLPQLSEYDLRVEAMIFAIALYIIGRGLREVEVDIGQLIAQIGSVSTGIPEYDATSGQWLMRESVVNEKLSSFRLGPAARIGLVAPLLLFALAQAKSGNPDGNNLLLVLLLMVPIGVLTYEVLKELPNDDKTRASAAWTLFLIGFPTSFFLHMDPSTAGEHGALLFDGILLLAPIIVDVALRKRGLEGEKNMVAGSATLLALLAIALLDTSGGLLAIPLFLLVLSRGFSHRQGLAIQLLGVTWVIWIWMLNLDDLPSLLIGGIIEQMPAHLVEVTFIDFIDFIKLPRWTGIGLIAIGLPSLLGWLNDRRLQSSGQEVDEHSHPFVIPTAYVLMGLFLLIPDSHWFLVAGVLAASLAAWSVGTMIWFYFSSLVLFLTLLNAGDLEWGFEGMELLRFAGAFTFVYNSALYLLELKGQLFKNVSDDYPAAQRENVVDAIVVYGIISAIIADTYLYGFALLLGVILFTQYAYKRRWANILLMIPVVHGWVIGRILADPLPDYAMELSGFVMLVESMGLTWASWQMWDFEWTDWSDDQVIEHSNNSGWAGALIFIPAAWLVVNEFDAWLFGGMLCVHSVGQMAIGFQRDVNWRRIYAMVGVSVGFVIIWSDIESGIMKGVMLVLASLSFMMQGFLYMNRAGIEMEGTRVVEIEPGIENDPPAVIPEPVSESEADESDDEESEEEQIDTESDSVVPSIELPVVEADPEYERIIGDRFDVELPLDVRHNIESTISSTEHDGFRPVIRWDPWGQVVLDWEPIGD